MVGNMKKKVISILFSVFTITLLSLILPQCVSTAGGADVSKNYESTSTVSLADPTPANDTTPPSASILINNGDAYTASVSVTLMLYYSDPESGVKDCKYSNDHVSWTSWENCSTTKSWALAPGDGSKTVYYQVRNNAGLVTEVSDSIILDTAPPPPPTIFSSTHPDEDRWYSNDNPYFTWTTPTDLSGIAGYSYVLDQSSSTIPDEGIEPPGTSKSYSNLDDGTWYFHVRAKDGAGNWGPADHYKVNIDTTPPGTPSLSESHCGPNWTSHNSPYFIWNDPGDAGSGVSHYEGSKDGGSPFTVSSPYHPTWEDGIHTFKVRAVDNVGLSGSWSNMITVKIDTTPPPEPVISSSTHSNEDAWYSNDDPSFTWTTPLDLSGIDGYSYSIDHSSSTIPDITIDASGNSKSYSNLEDGTWYFHVRAKDNAGNWGSTDHYRIKIDTSPPSTPTPLSPGEGTRLDVGPTFSWGPASDSLSGIASYTLQIDTSSAFNSKNLKVFTGITTASYALKDSLTVGKWYWRVCAVDKAGNVGPLSAHVSFVSDRILITDGGVTDDRVDVGTSSIVWFTAVYEYDGITFDSTKGVLYVNDLGMTWSAENSRWEKAYSYTGVAKYYFQVSSVKDLVYGLTVLNDKVGSESIIWDRVNVKLTVSDARINIGDTADITWTSVYEYDRTPFTGSLSLNDTKTKNVVGEYGYKVKSISDPKYGLTVFRSNAVSVVFDRVNITLSIADNRIDVGSEAPLSWTGIYEYDSTTFNGTVTYNNTQTIYKTVGRRGYTISSINDPTYGLTAFRSNSVYCIWDRIKIVDGGVTHNSTYVNQTETVWFQAAYEYDNVVFNASKGTLYVNGSAMTWSEKNNRWEHDFRFDIPGAKTFTVSNVSDILYDLTALKDMVGPQSIVWYIPTTFTISLTPSSSYTGFKVDVGGGLTHLNGSGISGSRVLLSYSVDGGETWIEITSVTSNLEGSYSAVWMPSARGNYIIRAVLEPSIWIGRELFWNLAVTSFENQYVFSVLSNSTVSDLVYDSTRRELRFTVSGQPGTMGYSSVTIAEDLAPGITDVNVYLDDDRLTYTHKFINDSWLLHFTYSHSIPHTVTIYLRSPTTLWVVLAGVLTIGIFIVIVLERRIKSRHVNRAK